jgi:hypothetical protein
MTAKQLREEIERLYSTVDPNKCQDDKKIIRREEFREEARERAKALDHAGKMREAWYAIPEEERQRIYIERSEAFANMSDKDRAKFSKMVSDGLANMSDDAKSEMRRKWLESVINRSPEYQEEIVNKIKNTWKNKPEHLRKQHAEKSAHRGADNHMYGNGYKVTGELNGFYGKTHSDDVKKKLSEGAKNRIKDKICEHCGEVVDSQTYGTHHGKYCKHNPNAIKRKTKAKAKSGPQEVVKCPHCYIEGGKGQLTRYHGDNCFMKGHFIQAYVNGKKTKVYKTHQSIVDDGILFDKVKLCCLGKKASVNGVVYKLIKKGK